MKNAIFTSYVAFTLFATAFGTYKATNWQISKDYAVNFVGTDVEGSFATLGGDIAFDESNLASSKFSVRIDANSINTGNGMKNKHAKSDKWFDAEKFPSISFTASKFSKTASGFEAEGILDLHGVKKTMTIPFTFSNNVFKGSFSVNRLDYGVGNMEGMSKKVSNEIKLDISVPVTKK